MGRYAFRHYKDALAFCELMRPHCLTAIGNKKDGFWWVPVPVKVE